MNDVENCTETDPKTLSASKQALVAIRRGIIEGTYPSGTMLSENELGAALQLSRTPIRSALARLQEDGWITIYPKRGAMVLGMSEQDITDMAKARLILEVTGIEETDSETRTRLAKRLHSNLVKHRQALESGDFGVFVQLTCAFHHAFICAGGNRYLIELGERLADQHARLLYQREEVMLAEAESVLADHEELLDSLETDDTDHFGDCLQRHFRAAHAPELGPV